MIEFREGKFYLKDSSYYERGFGRKVGLGKIELNCYEVLYLFEKGANVFGLDEAFGKVLKRCKFHVYVVYRYLRDKGYKVSFTPFKGEKKAEKVYRKNPISLDFSLRGFSLGDVVVSFDKEAKRLYEDYWLCQWGKYKEGKGSFAVFSPFEAHFLRERGVLEWEGKLNLPKRFDDLYLIYKDWVEKGYVLKSGFKFGSHFRMYFPHTTPLNFMHSVHLIHVFPKNYRVSAFELSKTIRVSHAVRKTFILALPFSLEKNKKLGLLFFDNYAVWPLFFREKIGWKELNSFLSFSLEHGLYPIVAFVDDEGAVSFYGLRKVLLEDSNYNYFEVEWFKF